MDYPIHHLHIRKRIHQKFEEYPNPNFWVKLLDNVMLVIAVIAPMANISQIIKVYTLKDADGLSLLSWFLYAVFNIFWILYGLVHREKPILVASLLWLITDLMVLYGILIY